MQNEYPVFHDQVQVGIAQVRKQGLYYEIMCCCECSLDGYPRLSIFCGTTKIDLGTCLKNGDKYEIHTKLPAKKLPEGAWVFRLSLSNQPDEVFYPIKQGEVFKYISLLHGSRLKVIGDSIGIICPK